MISNFQISRQLINEKARLINALSQFPAAACWLISEFEQQYGSTVNEDAEDVELLSESEDALSEIKKHYALANQSFLTGASDLADKKQRLTEALKLYPYSFSQLTRMVDLSIDAFKSRGLSIKESATESRKDFDIIKKRLDDCRYGNCLHNYQLHNSLNSPLDNPDHGRFLFLSCDEMTHLIPGLLMAEHRWLRLRERLTVANTRLVLFIANQYKGGFLEFDDLVQEGQTGLLKAVDRYDYQLGYKFSTYAGYWIRQAISRALSRCERVVRIPCGQIGVINKVFRVREQLIAKLGKEPSVQELSECAGLSPDEIHLILIIAQSSVALDASSEENDEVFSPIDFLEQRVFTHPFGDIAQSDLEKLLNKALKLLNPREARVICGHFGVQNGHEMTLKEIGNEMNLTRERVRQIQVLALNKIKQYYGNQLATCLL